MTKIFNVADYPNATVSELETILDSIVAETIAESGTDKIISNMRVCSILARLEKFVPFNFEERDESNNYHCGKYDGIKTFINTNMRFTDTRIIFDTRNEYEIIIIDNDKKIV